MRINKELLFEQEERWILPPELYSCWNARGLYDPTQFVLRLRPDIHGEIDLLEPGIRSSSELPFEHAQAFSTYFHETIHWWQHIGSTSGLMLSLIYPVQAHVNHDDLIKLLSDIGPVKSILRYNDLMHRTLSGETDKRVNRVLNNWHDIEFFRWFVLDPQKASSHVKSPYFENLGHSYKMAWSSSLWLLASTFDPDFRVISDVRVWEREFDALEKQKAPSFYYGSDITLPGLGAREIFEGQARFSQIQYLYFASGRNVSWEDFKHIGMLEGVYRAAFDIFLNLLDVQWPSTPEDPSVGLFLLVCDIAINPTDGFPFDIFHFPSFVLSVDPGMRFLQLCWAVQRHPNLLDSIQRYTKDEYMEVSEILCKEISCKSPMSAAEKVVDWSLTHPGFQALLEEDRWFDFSDQNLPLRVLFARFLRFQHDKLEVPEYFCWPGVWSTGVREGGITLERALELLDKNSALFVDGVDGDIYPRALSGKERPAIQKTFNAFYTWNTVYELTRQWTVGEGEFDFNFSWLTTKYSRTEVRDYVASNFERVYGVNPDSFRVM